ncbi:tetratricopeptide repeat protein [Loktanella sp. DJP18]|uniref:tetratricopeptide repeat protein n=1 Tax=Loktanella sp. DJP18 TaxID=3409788 RepID=UPI003BB6590D
MYGTGRGVNQDITEAVRWYRLAAEQGEPAAQSNLGVMYSTGEGVPENDAEAVRWYRLAAEKGYSIAQGNLGAMYATGEGVPADDTTAHMWMNIAGANGLEAARKDREKLEQRMTRDEISQAQDAARTCMSSGYTDCR